MTEIHGPELAYSIPDDLSIVQFMLDTRHPCKPAQTKRLPWMVDDATGREVYEDEVRKHVDGLANGLSSRLNIGYDDVVCIYSPNHIDYPITVWAAHRLGAVVTPANPAYTADELTYQLRITKCKLIVTFPLGYPVALTAARAVGLSPESIVLFDPLADARAAPHLTVGNLITEGLSAPRSFKERRLVSGEARTKLAFLCFSSGTTGLPKAVCIPHYALIANLIQMTYAIELIQPPAKEYTMRPGDTALGVLPFYHIYAIVSVMHWMPFFGLKLVIVPRFEFGAFLGSIERHRVNLIAVVPPMILLLCKHPAVLTHDLSSLRQLPSAAAPLAGELEIQLSGMLPQCQVSQGYGLTETCTVVTLPQHGQTPGCSGSLVPGTAARVVRPDGSLVPRGERGELLVRAPSNALGYLHEDKATRETFVDGWVHTGDEVYFNERNELFIVDRIKEMLKVRGFQVAPAELEGHLLEHPDVADACVVGVPAGPRGDAPVAFIVPSPSARKRIAGDPAEAERTKAALAKYVADTKVHYKRLTGGVEFVDAIPRNPTGKLLRRVLRDRARELLAKRAQAKL